MLKEFKEFISKGSVLDAAIGFVLGLSFKAIVDSVVDGVLLPLVGYLTAGIDFSGLKIVLKQGVEGVSEEVSLSYGQVIQSIVTFILVALFLFLVIRAINKIRRKDEKAPEEEPAAKEEAETELELLKDIRELLSKKED
ncbi:MAG TPA: large conductance mechanosensitive channel protein MscL [Clostridia bacterium]|nr:large conductance mechanosensitive channel protein MscL [Clostridia bacterium]